MAERARILVVEGTASDQHPASWDVVRAADWPEALARIQAETFHGLYVPGDESVIWQKLRNVHETDSILEMLGEGVAVIYPDLRIQWANATFEKWCGGPVKDRNFYEALGKPDILGPEFSPFYKSPPLLPLFTRLKRTDNQILELRVTVVMDGAGRVRQYIALCRDATAEVQQRQKLDALQNAGEEMTSFSAEQLADMSAADRIELLKQNIRRLTHDLLQYDVIEIRLLDPASGKLEPLAEGMTPEAASRILYAREEGNGVTGLVAATGKSYLCTDTATDPHYIEGAQGAHSSLTVALQAQNKVIGTFNVESPQLNAFGQQDLQFAEIFGRDVAAALHTLELLQEENRTIVAKSIDAINREVAMPVDEILNSATSLLDLWIGHEPEMAEKLRKILASARLVKQSIQKVGEDMTSGPLPLPVHPSPAPGRLKGMRVLVVDNDERVRRSAHGLLGRLGCTVETARDGKEAQIMARLSAYDAMLADIRLPDISGYELFRSLRQAQPRARVILMTGFGYDSAHSIVKARQDGLRHILYKPFRVDQLLSALESTEPVPALQPEPVQA